MFVGWLTSQQHASVCQGRICTDNFTCCHTEIEAADQTFYLTQSQYTDTGPTSPSADPITPRAWQGSHWSADPEKISAQAGFEPGIFRSRGGRLATRPTRRCRQQTDRDIHRQMKGKREGRERQAEKRKETGRERSRDRRTYIHTPRVDPKTHTPMGTKQNNTRYTAPSLSQCTCPVRRVRSAARCDRTKSPLQATDRQEEREVGGGGGGGGRQTEKRKETGRERARDRQTYIHTYAASRS